MTDWIESLERLSALRAAGHMTDSEFEAAKARILAHRRDEVVPSVSLLKAETVSEPLSELLAPTQANNDPPPLSSRRLPLAAGGGVLVVLLVALLVWLLLPPTTPKQPLADVGKPGRSASVAIAEQATFPPLATGETIEWTAATSDKLIERQAGPLVIRIVSIGSGDETAPVVTVKRGSESVRMEGERVASTYSHRITAIRNREGAPAAIMFQSFSGGAHCCNHVQLAGLSRGALQTVDLGSWDGDEIAPPKDISGDGTADFVFYDQAFLYAFAPYAMSHSVPKVLNVVGGKVIDVSARPAFRRLFTEAMTQSGATCRGDTDGVTRNGACAAYVAAAARVGRLQRAWDDMLAAYDPTTDWVLPTGCEVRETNGGCPEAQQITYKSYPEALLAFLKRENYVPQRWAPNEAPESSSNGDPEPPSVSDMT